MKKVEIYEYKTNDEALIKKYYTQLENKKRQNRLLNVLKTREQPKKIWGAGIVGIFGIQLSKLWNFKTTTIVFLECLLWTSVLVTFYFKRLGSEYDLDIQNEANTIIQVLTQNKSWVAKDKSQEIILGTIAITLEKDQARIDALTALNDKVRQKLVQTAFNYSKENQIEVVIKSKQLTLDSKWGSTFLNK